MQVATNDRLPFIGMEIIKIDGSLETRVYRKKTNKGLLLLYQSHVDSRYFTAKNNVRPRKTLVVYARIPFARIFSKLKYPEKLIDSAINRLQHRADPVLTPSDSHLKIRNRLMWFADNLATSERKLISNCSQCSRTKRSLII